MISMVAVYEWTRDGEKQQQKREYDQKTGHDKRTSIMEESLIPA